MPPSFKPASSVLLVASEQQVAQENRTEVQSQIGEGKIEVITYEQLSNIGNASYSFSTNAFSLTSTGGSAFDGVLSVSSKPHTTQALTQLFAVLKSGGTLILREPVR